jgi:hypothetical protein
LISWAEIPALSVTQVRVKGIGTPVFGSIADHRSFFIFCEFGQRFRESPASKIMLTQKSNCLFAPSTGSPNESANPGTN